MSEGFAEKAIIDLLPQSSGSGGQGTSDYSDLTNKPKINSNTLSGNKTSSQLGLQDVLVSGTNIKTINSTSLLGSGNIDLVSDVQVNGTSVVSSGVANIPVATQDTLGVSKVSPTYGLTVSNGIIVGSTKTASVYSTAANSLAICKGTLDNIQNDFVRSVSPACTTITAASTTATISANTTYAHAVSSSGCTYTLTTPSSTDVYSGFILMIDTTSSASIAFQTDGSPASTIKLNGNVTPETGKKYTVTGQWDVLNSVWQLFILDYSVS